jgi:mercuric ion transport protein
MAEPAHQVTTGPEGAARQTPTARRGLLASFGAVGAAFLASLCCIGPVLFVTLGVGAGLAARFEPLRPVFTILTVALLALGFYVVYGRRPAAADGIACGPDERCSAPRHLTRDKIVLWVATTVALALLTFPQWSKLLV